MLCPSYQYIILLLNTVDVRKKSILRNTRLSGENITSFSSVSSSRPLPYWNILTTVSVRSRNPRRLTLGSQIECSEGWYNTHLSMGYMVSQIRLKRWMTTNKGSVRTILSVKRTIKVDIRYFLGLKQTTQIQENVDKSRTYIGG